MAKPELYLIKIGGNVIDDPKALNAFLEAFAKLPGNKLLVHGGGKIATQMSTRLGLETKMVNGRRITDLETLQIVTMSYAGWINKQVTTQLRARGINAVGLSGVDGGLLQGVMRNPKPVDYGFVADVNPEDVGVNFLKMLLDQGFVPVISPITNSASGQLLNLNADTMAATLAAALQKEYEVKLVYCFEKPGLLRNPKDDNSLIEKLANAEVEQLKAAGIISGGMLPKIENCLLALDYGVNEVLITSASAIGQLTYPNWKGTRIHPK